MDLFEHAESKSRAAFPTAEAALEALSKGNEDWISLAATIAGNLCARNGEFTTDDLWEVIQPPPGTKPQIIGAVTRKAMARGTIVKTGEFRDSRRPECHRRPIPVYRPGRP